MLELKFDRARWAQDSEGFWLSLRVMDKPKARKFVAALENGVSYLARLGKAKMHRSLDANAYFWVLLDRLAAETNIPKLEIYQEAVKAIGGNSETVCVKDDAVKKLRAGWEHNGMGWVTETMPSKIPGCTNVILYYGSSTYDTAQMSRLVDNIVQDCQAVGIETKTPEELEKLKSLWEEKSNAQTDTCP